MEILQCMFCVHCGVRSGMRPKKQLSQSRLPTVRCALRRNASCESSTGACCADDDGPPRASVYQYDRCAETGFDPRPVHVIFVVDEVFGFFYISARVRRFALSVSFHHCSLLMFGSYITDAYKLAIIASLVTAVLSVAKIKQVKSVLTIGLYFILIWIC